ncbi:MAG: lysophospholipase, partial [Cyanobacteria bacterium J083]
NLLGVQHIYLINQQNQCLYAGFVGLLDRPYLQPKLIAISNKFK